MVCVCLGHSVQRPNDIIFIIHDLISVCVWIFFLENDYYIYLCKTPHSETMNNGQRLQIVRQPIGQRYDASTAQTNHHTHTHRGYQKLYQFFPLSLCRDINSRKENVSFHSFPSFHIHLLNFLALSSTLNYSIFQVIFILGLDTVKIHWLDVVNINRIQVIITIFNEVRSFG